MKNNYYIPKKEEFYHGFEYERLNGEGKFTPMIYGTESMQCSFKDMDKDMENCRVKYLDQEDVESLGFNRSLDEPDEWFSSYKGNSDIQFYFDDKKENKELGKGISIYNETLEFSGYIKNKSELKKLLKQIRL